MQGTGKRQSDRGGGAGSTLLARLGRRTTSGTFLPVVDGLRFVAIAMVVAFHLSIYAGDRGGAAGVREGAWGVVAAVAARGHLGVHLFFLLSGFVLALPFARAARGEAPPVALGRYYLRRVTRLEPPYLLSLCLFYGALVWQGRDATSLLPHLAASAAYLHGAVYGTMSAINGVAWSLEVEVQFYLLAPLLGTVYRLAPRVRRALLLSGALAAAVVQVAYIGPDTRLSLSLPNYLQYFLLGFLLADLFLDEWRGDPAPGARFDLVGLAGVVLLGAGDTSRWAPALVPVGVLAVAVAAFRGRRAASFLARPWVVVTGGMCYTIYLLHYPLLSAVGRVLGRFLGGAGPFAWTGVLLCAYLPILAAVSLAFFLAIERPCMRPDWPARLWRGLCGRGA